MNFEAVAHVAGRYFELDVDGSAFYLTACSEEAPSEIEERLGRISDAAEAIIESMTM